MTKRSLESDLEELSEELLGDLTPAERLQLTLTASATGHDEWLEQLTETCPRARYEQPEWAFTARTKFALMLGQQAVYDLRTTTFLFGWTDTKYRVRSVLTFFTGLDPSEYGFEYVPRETRAAPFRELYIHYKVYEQFADTELGVALDDWLAVHPDGPATVAMAEEILAEYAGLRDLAEAGLTDEENGDGSLDDFADQYTEELRDTWREIEDRIE